MTESRTWRKSTYSSPQNDCVELVVGERETAVRDTKDREGGHLTFSASAFAAFLAEVRAR
ncbi:DUF397 domain-containing protein [Amycolatopsis anabasis]|uniref:DUF397 domain-containing protein n=1 Tax=Amycolatopsis anabasis TaxID=1840409 RepID=UPI00131C2E3D|nr:DUF397 domain-containing protein [Amycolatopsis anabasis]